MLDILYGIFKSILEGLNNIDDVVNAIPSYIGLVKNFVVIMPSYLSIFFGLVLSTVTLISIKRLISI